MNEIKKLVAELVTLCERFDISYGIFYSESPHSISGSANFSTEELAILIEKWSETQPIEQLKLFRHIIDLIIQERLSASSSWN